MDNIVNESKQLLIIYLLIIISVILTMFIIPNFFPTQYRIINLILWGIIFVRTRGVQNQHNRFKAQKEELKTIFIIVFIYLIGYYLSGLIFGYTKSIYAHTLKGLAYNFALFIVVILFKEYTRSRLINNTRSTFMYIVITILFIILDFNYNNFFDNFATGEIAFKFIASQVYPTILRGILCSFLVKKGSYKLSLMFRLPITVIEYITPVFPDIDWFVTVAFESVLVILIYYFINYEYMINVERFTRKEIKYGNPKSTLPTIVFVLIFTFFVAGLFPVQPVALLSNSMKPYIKRGDVALVTKIKQEDLKNICIGDIIEYKLDDKTIIHRVVNIVEGSGGELTFTTKGDANENNDANPVLEEQVVGVVKHYIPYVGYPSVIFSEEILKVENN